MNPNNNKKDFQSDQPYFTLAWNRKQKYIFGLIVNKTKCMYNLSGHFRHAWMASFLAPDRFLRVNITMFILHTWYYCVFSRVTCLIKIIKMFSLNIFYFYNEEIGSCRIQFRIRIINMSDSISKYLQRVSFKRLARVPGGHTDRRKAKKEEIWLSPMTKAATSTEMSKGQSHNTNNPTKKFDYM